MNSKRDRKRLNPPNRPYFKALRTRDYYRVTVDERCTLVNNYAQNLKANNRVVSHKYTSRLKHTESFSQTL